MSRKATCLDNAVAENFFGLLKTCLLYTSAVLVVIAQQMEHGVDRQESDLSLQRMAVESRLLLCALHADDDEMCIRDRCRLNDPLRDAKLFADKESVGLARNADAELIGLSLIHI